jgi:hypothetical protein
MTEEWGDNTAIVVGVIIDKADWYNFKAIWNYIKW